MTQAIRAAEAVAEVFAQHHDAADVNRLFDHELHPTRNQWLAEIARRLQVGTGLTLIDPVAPGVRPYERDDPALQDVPLLHFVGSPGELYAVRDLDAVRTSWRYLWSVRWTTGQCDIGDAAECVSGVGPTTYVTVSSYLPFLVIVEVCDPCLNRLREVAEGGEILTEIPASIAADAAGEATVARWRAIRKAQAGGEECPLA